MGEIPPRAHAGWTCACFDVRSRARSKRSRNAERRGGAAALISWGAQKQKKRVELLSARYPTRESGPKQRARRDSGGRRAAAEHKLPSRTARDLFADPVGGSMPIGEWRWVAGLRPAARRDRRTRGARSRPISQAGRFSLNRLIAGAAPGPVVEMKMPFPQRFLGSRPRKNSGRSRKGLAIVRA